MDALDAVRAASLGRTLALLDRVDLSDVEVGVRRISAGLTLVRYQAREEALSIALEVARQAAADAIGADLGWRFTDIRSYVSEEGRLQNMRRLARVARSSGDLVRGGQDPVVVFNGVRTDALTLAGSEPHRLARIVSAEICASNPVVGRWQRFAEANACAYCRMLASRGAVYHRQETARASGHRHCRCRLDVVEDPAECRRVAEGAWREYASTTGARRRPEFFKNAEKFRPGQVTPERAASVRAQLDSYETVLANGGGTDWTRQRVVDLRAELAAVTAAL